MKICIEFLKFLFGYFVNILLKRSGDSPAERDNEERSDRELETTCYIFNYERFAHHEAGPDDGDVPPITPANFKFDDDIDDGVDMCVLKVEGEEVDRIPCDCSNPREFMKNMFNKGMFFYFKIS